MNRLLGLTFVEILRDEYGYDGYAISGIYVYWFKDHIDEILKDWFEGDYTDEHILNAHNALLYHVISKFHEWCMEGGILHRIKE